MLCAGHNFSLSRFSFKVWNFGEITSPVFPSSNMCIRPVGLNSPVGRLHMSTPDMLAPPGLRDVTTYVIILGVCVSLKNVHVYYYSALGSLNHPATSSLPAHLFRVLRSSHPPAAVIHPAPPPPSSDPGFMHIFTLPTSLDRLVKWSSPTSSLKPAIHSPLIGSVSPPYVHIPIIQACTRTRGACRLVSVLNRCSAVKRTVRL